MNQTANMKKKYCTPIIGVDDVFTVDSYLYTGSFGFDAGSDGDDVIYEI